MAIDEQDEVLRTVWVIVDSSVQSAIGSVTAEFRQMMSELRSTARGESSEPGTGEKGEGE